MTGHTARTRRFAALAATAAMTVAATTLSGSTAGATALPVPHDINGDGYGDIVLPAPGATVAGKAYAGAVVVLYGSAKGVSAAKRAVITQNSPGVPGAAEEGDAFGASIALADLDKDGFADIVVGSPHEKVGSRQSAGAVTVLWGGKKGPASGVALPTLLESQGQAGRDVAAWSGSDGAQVLVVNNNNATRLTGPFKRSGKIVASSYLHDETGYMNAAAFGDLNGDKAADRVLVNGRMGGRSGGAVYVNSTWERLNQLHHGDGLFAAVGDVNGDGYGDVVLGDPDDPHPTEGPIGHLGGAVHVWFGSKTGVAYDKAPMTIHQDTAGVPGGGERDDAFGASVAVADLNRDGAAEIIVGVPGEAVGKKADAGGVVVVPGRRTGQLGSGSYAFTQDTAGVPGGVEAGDRFGATVSVGDLNKNGRPDLVVGAAQENGQGAVWVLPGGASGPLYTSSASFGPGSLGLSKNDWLLLGGDHRQ
ncbi:FG-GAP-like repeat-containing protein [Streptomyces sp. MBT55]|uniref:FG-GAP-like repeat-containing protein n=1 Tax=Streptomyces sp. MBT55 TaxID=1488386 RepID=UPI0019127AEF|nr:FG-GAP-like repeat-containing protein [Streptomyces sp. MBT55]MBK6044348.1 FG-GAP repeat protein [Streptomyces sp. MBT55]